MATTPTTPQRPAAQPPSAAVSDALAQVTRRLRLQRWVRHASRGLLMAVVLAFVAVGLAHWGLLPEWLPLEAVLPLVLLLGLGAGTLTTYLRPISAMDAARLAEARLGLKERLSSALDFERAGPAPSDPEAALLLRLQGEDAAEHARRLRATDAVPLRLPWEAKVLIPALILLLLALVLPSLPVFTPPALRTERAVVGKEGEKLTRTAKAIEKQADAKGLTGTKRAAQTMQKLGQRMQQGRMDKKQAMVQMDRLSKQMADEQRRLAQANGPAGENSKDLQQAGRQLDQSLGNGSSAKNAKTNSAATPGKAGQQAGNKGQAGGSSQARSGKPTPEVRQASQAMQRGDTKTVSQKLRELAQRAESGHMSPTEQQQAAEDLQKLSRSLQGTSYGETQQHAQAASDALKRGDTQTAAREMRQAADAADREAQRQADAQGMQDAQQTVENGQREIGQADKPGDISPDGQPGQSGQQGQAGQKGGASPQGGAGKQPGQGSGPQSKSGSGQGSGSPSNEGNGGGRSTVSRPGQGQYTPASGRGQKTPGQNTGIVRGAPHPLNPQFDPTKNPKYGKIFLGKPNGTSGGGKSLPPGKPGPPDPATGSHQASSVPYYNYAPPARKSAESAMDKEDIPPSYKSGVRRYFDSLPSSPPAGGTRK